MNIPVKVIIDYKSLGVTPFEFDKMIMDLREDKKELIGNYGSFDIFNENGSLHSLNYAIAALNLAEDLTKRNAQ